MKKRNPAFLFMLTVMAGTAAVLIALGVILLSLFAGDKKHDGEQRPKSEIIIQTVREHAETILEDIEQNDLERTLAFFDGFREKPHVNREETAYSLSAAVSALVRQQPISVFITRHGTLPPLWPGSRSRGQGILRRLPWIL